ncbi:MAG: GyrI-like domain-containing protein [Chloroflexi bacterium]|nr:GyrI-like domain-containing protein [Chloroflexota bacterium]
MITPTLEDRRPQPYVGIRTEATLQQLPEVVPELLYETEIWLDEQGVELSGVPFIRYHVIDMQALLDIEVGCTVDRFLRSDARVSVGIIPAGRYATLVYRDVVNGIDGNRTLIEWAEKMGLVWDAWDTELGQAFRSRLEFFLDGPDDSPDPAKWRTQVAIRLADERPETLSIL